jgi:hypothetical protein
MIVAVDTNVIITAYAWWDGRQDAAVRAINRFADEGIVVELVRPAHRIEKSPQPSS